MTTIATDGKSMAGDGQTTRDNHAVCFSTRKVLRSPTGKIVGFCGDSGDENLFIEWLENGGKKPKTNSTFVVLYPDGPPRVFFHDLSSAEIDVPYAIGSGGQLALAAMDCGKSPSEAVAIASTRDVYTGGVIISLDMPTQLQAVAA